MRTAGLLTLVIALDPHEKRCEAPIGTLTCLGIQVSTALMAVAPLKQSTRRDTVNNVIFTMASTVVILLERGKTILRAVTLDVPTAFIPVALLRQAEARLDGLDDAAS
jgi:hypothetical protein